MVLIFGGAYQGKLGYAMERYGFSEDEAAVCPWDVTEFPEGRVAVHLERWIYSMVKEGRSASRELSERIRGGRLPEVVVMDDVTQGVVPVDAVLRTWRDEAGRCMQLLTKSSDEVVRVFMGIGKTLKS